MAEYKINVSEELNVENVDGGLSSFEAIPQDGDKDVFLK